jgi:hypothetical protein
MSTSKHTSASQTADAPRPVQRGHHVAAQFSAWGVQRVEVNAGGGGDQPYIAVTVGTA